MESLGLWIQPALLLPGVGLLLMSTTARFGQLEGMVMAERDPQPLQRLSKCAQELRMATVSLYVSVCVLALGSLVGGLTVSQPGLSNTVVTISVFVAVGLVVFASFMLILESGRALRSLPAPHGQNDPKS